MSLQPPPVEPLAPAELAERLRAGDAPALFDVRGPDERARAAIAGDRALDEAAMRDIDAMPRDAPLAFYCHHGIRSLAAAEYFRQRGHTRVYNLSGGIDAWSRDVDAAVPRY